MKFPHPIKKLRADRAAKREAKLESIREEGRQQERSKKIEQIEDEARKARILADQQRAAIDRVLEGSAKELDQAHKGFARSLDRMSKFTRRMQTFINWLTIPFIVFEAIMLGRDLTQHDWNSAITDGFFVVIFGLMTLGRYLDLQYEAKRGAELRHDLEGKTEERALQHKLDRAKAEGRREAEENGMQIDGNDMVGALKDLHFDMLTTFLEEIVTAVIEEKHGGKGNVPKGYQPTDEDAREIERRFKEKTGHTVKMSWEGDGWAIDLDEGHHEHDHHTESPNNADGGDEAKAPAGKPLPQKGVSQARRAAKKASKK